MVEETSSIAQPIVVATRVHLGNAKEPPTGLDTKLRGFLDFCAAIGGIPMIAVDSATKIFDYDLVSAVQDACLNARTGVQSCSSAEAIVLPVNPWGKFVPALNALIGEACTHESKPKQILFVSAETKASAADITKLRTLVEDPRVLVAGAALPGHAYVPRSVQELNGRTTPWNTLAVWDLQKIAMTGFALISEGYLTVEPSYGVEEVVAIAMLQKILGRENAIAKLVTLESIDWNQSFDDPERKRWHEEKMSSKLERPERQLDLLDLSGIVDHL